MTIDWQGDNVLLARENILATVIESFNADFFNESSSSLGHFIKAAPPSLPGLPCLLEFAEIISWNVWQMDGLTKTIPFNKKQENEQQDMFSMFFDTKIVKEEERKSPPCRVYDWKANKSVAFDQIGGRNE